MKKIFFSAGIFAILVPILSLFIANKEQPEVLNEIACDTLLTSIIDHSSTGRRIEVTATGAYYNTLFGEYDMDVEDGFYAFTICEYPVEGKEYTLADMDANTGFYPNEFDFIQASAATLKVDIRNGLPFVIGTMTLGGIDYAISHSLSITGTVNITADNLSVSSLSSGGLEYTFNDADWTVYLDIPSATRKTGTFYTVDMENSVLVPVGNRVYPDGVFIAAVTEPIVVSQNDNTMTLTGKVVVENGTEYVLNVTCQRNAAKETSIR